ncbi:hypothetical protein OHA72_20895 [Dactylosporangium sp. NBC_01737]|uniref:hypothetical protein n=1 Tax=Dactylosporangium sp. NBC_01737 TaxID=2975959 RepID=UPI002E0E0EA9|nr:hypothetical protein OHA72_20895 [Dactylosporangium sp. NBC_01737]
MSKLNGAARAYAPATRLDAEPSGPFTLDAVRVEAVRDALRGVDLGAYDERIITWMVRTLDDSTARTIVSLIERARLAEAKGCKR